MSNGDVANWRTVKRQIDNALKDFEYAREGTTGRSVKSTKRERENETIKKISFCALCIHEGDIIFYGLYSTCINIIYT